MYGFTVFIGRFQPFHKGHLHNIIKALDVSEKIIINVGSSYNAPSIKNPFSFEQRKAMIISDLKISNIDLNRVYIEPIADYFYQEQKWEDSLRINVNKHIGQGDKVAIIGHKKDSSSYYLNSFKEWDYISVSNYKSYNATDFRNGYYCGRIDGEYMVSQDCNAGSYLYLSKFMETNLYRNLVDEYRYVNKCKLKSSVAKCKTIKIVADSLVIINNRILLIQNNSIVSKDLWSLPGGELLDEENIYQATIRSLRDTTSIEIEEEQLDLSRYDTYMFDYPSRSVLSQIIANLNFPYFRQAANFIMRFSHKALLFFCMFVSFLQTRSLLY